jgi:hypothetical protein
MTSTWMIITQVTAWADLCSTFALNDRWQAGLIEQLLNGFGFATASRDVHGDVDNPRFGHPATLTGCASFAPGGRQS